MLARLRRGDAVVIVAGKEKGKRGKVLRVSPGNRRVVVEHCAMVKRHTKPSQKNPQGGIVEKEGSIDVSNVALLCPKCDRPRRFRVTVSESANRLRVCAKCGTEVQAAA